MMVDIKVGRTKPFDSLFDVQVVGVVLTLNEIECRCNKRHSGRLRYTGYMSRENWAEQKLNHASWHCDNLERHLDVWRGSGSISVVSKVSDDRLRLHLDLSVTETPPTEIWSLTAGDCVHNIRCSFDAWLWGKALEREVPLQNEKRIQFPFADKPKEFSNNRDQLARDINAKVLDAIEKVQPYRIDPNNGLRRCLELIRDLDNQNKHRFPAVTKVGVADVLAVGLSLEFDDDDSAQAEDPEAASEYYLPPLTNGGRLLTYSAKSPIKTGGQVRYQLDLKPHIEFEGNDLPLIPQLRKLMDAAAKVLTWLESQVS